MLDDPPVPPGQLLVWTEFHSHNPGLLHSGGPTPLFGFNLLFVPTVCIYKHIYCLRMTMFHKNPLNQEHRLDPWWHYEDVLNTNIHTKLLGTGHS